MLIICNPQFNSKSSNPYEDLRNKQEEEEDDEEKRQMRYSFASPGWWVKRIATTTTSTTTAAAKTIINCKTIAINFSSIYLLNNIDQKFLQEKHFDVQRYFYGFIFFLSRKYCIFFAVFLLFVFMQKNEKKNTHTHLQIALRTFFSNQCIEDEFEVLPSFAKTKKHRQTPEKLSTIWISLKKHLEYGKKTHTH